MSSVIPNYGGYGASWREGSFHQIPMLVPDIVRSYARAPLSNVSPYTKYQGMAGLGFAPATDIYPEATPVSPWWYFAAGLILGRILSR